MAAEKKAIRAERPLFNRCAYQRQPGKAPQTASIKLSTPLHHLLKTATGRMGMKMEAALNQATRLFLRKNAKTLKKKGIVCSV